MQYFDIIFKLAQNGKKYVRKASILPCPGKTYVKHRTYRWP
jgi:hypothetical protein